MRTIAASGLIALTAMLGVAASAAVAGPATASQTTASQTRAASPPPAKQLFGVSCVSSKYCVAVGLNQNAEGNRGGGLIQTWNGKNWKTVAALTPKGGLSSELLGVSCKTTTACVAVGLYLNSGGSGVPLVEAWNGRTWTPSAPPRPAGSQGGQLASVSCAGPKSCVAIGTYYTDSGAAALAESWNGGKWTLSRPPAPKGSIVGDLEKVSCPTTAFCIAVGTSATNKGGFVLADRWNGKTWAMTSVKPPANAKNDASLNGVSCRSAKSCVAVGTGTPATGRPGGLRSFAEFWDGKTWTAGTISWPKGTSNNYLVGVSCAAANSCLAVGYVNVNLNVNGAHTGKAAATRWNGKTWTATAVPAPGKAKASLFNEVSCPAAASCLAVGQLGTYGTDEGNGLAGFWNGKIWTMTTTP